MNHCLLMQLYISQVQDVESSSSCTKIGWIFWKNKKSVVIQRWFPLKKKNTITTQGRRISLQSRGVSAWQIEQPERYVREQKTEAQFFCAS